MIFENYKWRALNPCVFLYFGEQEEQYKRWISDDDPEQIKPTPTYILSEEEMNKLTVSWLTGPPQPMGENNDYDSV